MNPLAYLTALALPTADEPSPSPSAVVDPPELTGDITDVSWWSDLLVGPVLRTAVIIIGALVLRFILFKVIDGFIRGLESTVEDELPKAQLRG